MKLEDIKITMLGTTGAGKTSLYATFWERYKYDIEKRYKPQTFHAGSAGGVLEFEGYILDDLELGVAESVASLEAIELHIKSINEDDDKLYGNLGQDFIKQFNEMIISFKSSSVLFR